MLLCSQQHYTQALLFDGFVVLPNSLTRTLDRRHSYDHFFGSDRSTADAACPAFALGVVTMQSMPLTATKVGHAFHRAVADAGNIFAASGGSSKQPAYRG
jgi:hypothetical protein